MNRRIDPLSQEERELAERLGRLGGPREPAPALDAAILAAARTAVAEDAAPPATLAAAPLPAVDTTAEPKLETKPEPATPATPTVTPFRPRRTVPRWPLGLSVAASLVLAAGIGWKLQGDGEGNSAEAAKSMSASAPAAAEDAVILDPALDRAPVQAPPPPPPLEEDAARRVAEEAPASQQALAKTAAARKDDAFADGAMAADAMQAPAAPAAPAAAAPMAATAAAPERETDISVSREAKGYLEVSGGQVPRTPIGDGRNAEVGAAEYTRTPLEQRREQAKSVNRAADADAAPAPPPPAPSMTVPERARQAGQGLAGNAAVADKPTGAAAENAERYDDRPPVSADSPAFRQAWLQRIRTLLAKGDTVAGGNSLQEFRRRYPGVELPDDLRRFAATLPPPAP